MIYLLDTNIIIQYLRDSDHRKKIDDEFDPFGPENTAVISVVTVGELKSLAIRNRWGKRRMEVLDSIFADVVITDINSKDVLEAYAAIDSFSQGGPSDYEVGTSARNMGKNDLWIAATASVLGAILITSDKDFEHLDGKFLTIGYYGAI